MEDGVIKYKCNWNKSEGLKDHDYKEIEIARAAMIERKWIGHDLNFNVGYGNISQRINQKKFIISGTQTGHLKNLSFNEYSLVTDYNIDQNSLEFTGSIKASSESLTHAAIYHKSPQTNCIIHIHDNDFWQKLIHQNIGVTKKSIDYGTPEMAYDIFRLFDDNAFIKHPIITMQGHQGGIISFGKKFQETIQALIKLY